MNTCAARLTAIRNTLQQRFSPDFLEVMDDSARHAGHPGAANGAGHYIVEIAAACFNGRSRIEVHRAVYAALAEFFPQQIHALQIRLIDQARIRSQSAS